MVKTLIDALSRMHPNSHYIYGMVPVDDNFHLIHDSKTIAYSNKIPILFGDIYKSSNSPFPEYIFEDKLIREQLLETLVSKHEFQIQTPIIGESGVFPAQIIVSISDEPHLPGKKYPFLINIFDMRNAEKEKALKEVANQKAILSTIYHDCNNALTTIMGYTQIIQTDCTFEQAKGYYEEIEKASLRLKSTLDLMANSSEICCNPSPLNLYQTLISKFNFYSSDFQKKGIAAEINNRDFSKSTQVYADKYHLNSVLDNLISNAVASMSGVENYLKAEILLSSSSDQFSYVDIKSSTSLPNHINSSNIFCRGVSGNSSSGNGLSNSRSLMDMNGGNLELLSSNADIKEVCFRITLPVYRH